jgi:nitroreductase
MILEILQRRHSLRVFEQKKIPEETIIQLARAARLAPSCYNDQPWMFLFCQKEQDQEGWQKIINALDEFNQGWAKGADLLVVVAARTVFMKNNKENRWGPFDSGAAALALVLEAVHLGLMAHQMGGFDPEKIRLSFSLPENFIPYSVMAIGYEPKEVKVPPKDRLPMKQNFFRNNLQTPLSLKE